MELNLTLFAIICALIGIIYGTLTAKINKLEVKQENLHENLVPKVQKLDDIQGTKIELLEKKIDKLEVSIQNLSDNLHKTKNQENQLTIAITKLYQHLEKNEKSNY